MVRRIEHGEADVVVGTRGAEGGSYGEFSLGRRIVSGVAALLAKLFLRGSIANANIDLAAATGATESAVSDPSDDQAPAVQARKEEQA